MTKQLKDKNEFIDELYRATTCCYHRDRPTTQHIISGIGEYPNYGIIYVNCAQTFFDSSCNCDLGSAIYRWCL